MCPTAVRLKPHLHNLNTTEPGRRESENHDPDIRATVRLECQLAHVNRQEQSGRILGTGIVAMAGPPGRSLRLVARLCCHCNLTTACQPASEWH